MRSHHVAASMGREYVTLGPGGGGRAGEPCRQRVQRLVCRLARHGEAAATLVEVTDPDDFQPLVTLPLSASDAWRSW
ncbi:hypothetical protein OHR68_35945 [Spirillospora sp. NBC_00431]